MQPKIKAVFLKLKPQEHKKLSQMKLKYSANYGLTLTWEKYIMTMASQVDAKVKELSK